MFCIECGKIIKNPKNSYNGYGPICYEKKFGKKPKEKEDCEGLPEDYSVPGQMTIFEFINGIGYNFDKE